MNDTGLSIEVRSPDDLRFLESGEHTYKTFLDIDLYCDTVDLSYLEDFEILRRVRIRVKRDLDEISVDFTPLFKHMTVERIDVQCEPPIRPPKYTFTIEPLALLHNEGDGILSVSGHPWSFNDSSPRTLRWMVEAHGWSLIRSLLHLWQNPANVSRPVGGGYRSRPAWLQGLAAAMSGFEAWRREFSQSGDVDPDLENHIYRSMGFVELIGNWMDGWDSLDEIMGRVIQRLESARERDHSEGKGQDYDRDYNAGKDRLHYEIHNEIEEYLFNDRFGRINTSEFDIELMHKAAQVKECSCRGLVSRILELRREEVHNDRIWDRIRYSSRDGLVDPEPLWDTYYGQVILESMGIERGVRVRESEIKNVRDRVEALISKQDEHFSSS